MFGLNACTALMSRGHRMAAIAPCASVVDRVRPIFNRTVCCALVTACLSQTACHSQTASHPARTRAPVNMSAGLVATEFERIRRRAGQLAEEGDYDGALQAARKAIDGDPTLIREIAPMLDAMDKRAEEHFARGNWGVAITLTAEGMKFLEMVRLGSLERVGDAEWESVEPLRRRHIENCRSQVVAPMLDIEASLYRQSIAIDPTLPDNLWVFAIYSAIYPAIYPASAHLAKVGWSLNDNEEQQQEALCINHMVASLSPWMTETQRIEFLRIESALKSEAGSLWPAWENAAAACAKIRLSGES